jgi:hypothetical protein
LTRNSGGHIAEIPTGKRSGLLTRTATTVGANRAFVLPSACSLNVRKIIEFPMGRVVIFVQVGLLTALTAIQFRAEPGTILTRRLNSGLTSADSGLQLVLEIA